MIQLRSRGEFALEELPGGRTRLIGRTWYTLQIAPRPYWEPFARHFIARIHLRVLEHIRVQAEQRTEGR